MLNEPKPAKTAGWTWGILVALVALLTLNWVAAVARFQVNGLFGDQWSFFTPLFEEQGWSSLFTWQHGPHRQGIAFVLSAAVLHLSDWDVRIESLWIVSCLAVSTGLAWGLKVRVGGCIRITDTWIVIAGLSLVQYETLLLVPNASHSVFPLFLLMVAAHLLVSDGARRRGAPVLIGVIGGLTLFTGFGIFVGAALAGALGRRLIGGTGDRLGAAVGLLLVALTAAAFAVGYTFSPASDGYRFPPQSLLEWLRFMGLMLASRMGMEVPSGWAVSAGAMVGLMVLWVLAVRGRRAEAPAPSSGREVGGVLLVVGFSYLVFTALGRVHLGESAAMASRYVTLLVTIWWGLDLWVAGFRSRHWPRMVSLVGWVMALGPWVHLAERPMVDWLGTVGLRDGDLMNLRSYQNRKLAWIAEYQEHGDWREAERRVPQGVFPFVGTMDMTARVAWLETRGLSFAGGDPSRWAWLPWAPEDTVIWWRPRAGGAWRNTPEGARMVVRAPHAGYLDLEIKPSAPDSVRLGWGGQQGPLLSRPGERLQFSLRVEKGSHELQMEGVSAVHRPRLSDSPSHPTWSWTREGWRPDWSWVVVDGFHGWEAEGGHGWTTGRLQARVQAHQPTFINVIIADRFEPVASGEVTVRLGARTGVVPWAAEGAAFSIRVPADGTTRTFVLTNAGGALSPASLGWWQDERPLALRLERLSADATPTAAVLELE